MCPPAHTCQHPTRLMGQKEAWAPQTHGSHTRLQRSLWERPPRPRRGQSPLDTCGDSASSGGQARTVQLLACGHGDATSEDSGRPLPLSEVGKRAAAPLDPVTWALAASSSCGVLTAVGPVQAVPEPGLMEAHPVQPRSPPPSPPSQRPGPGLGSPTAHWPTPHASAL